MAEALNNPTTLTEALKVAKTLRENKQYQLALKVLDPFNKAANLDNPVFLRAVVKTRILTGDFTGKTIQLLEKLVEIDTDPQTKTAANDLLDGLKNMLNHSTNDDYFAHQLLGGDDSGVIQTGTSPGDSDTVPALA